MNCLEKEDNELRLPSELFLFGAAKFLFAFFLKHIVNRWTDRQTDGWVCIIYYIFITYAYIYAYTCTVGLYPHVPFPLGCPLHSSGRLVVGNTTEVKTYAKFPPKPVLEEVQRDLTQKLMLSIF